jgi:lipoprotein-anchoring transpeptidase ErfK/SrfK
MTGALPALAGLWLAVGAPPAAAVPPSVVAQAAGSVVTVYQAPVRAKVLVTLANPAPGGQPWVFLVKSRRRGWDEVYLPRRPNGSTGWVKATQVVLALDAYRVDVSLSAHTVTVWKNDVVVDRDRAGVGTARTPTPTGRFYLAELLVQPKPDGEYGPYAFGLSAFSTALSSFGGGPGQIGLHGTNDPAGLGTNVSHGCVRIDNAAITRLAHVLPLGTPVTITR